MTRVLLDTHAVLWDLEDHPGLSPLAVELLDDPSVERVVSAVTPLEVAVKRSAGRLASPDDLLDVLDQAGATWLPVTLEHGWRVRTLPLHHRDPFDRLLVAQAQIEGLAILTADPLIARYDVATLW